MNIAKEKIQKIRRLKEIKIEYYSRVEEHITSLRKQISSLILNPTENIMSILDIVRENNIRLSDLF